MPDQACLSGVQVDSELVTERIRSSQAAAQHRIDQQALVTSATAAEKKAALHAQQAAQLQADLQVHMHQHTASVMRHPAAKTSTLLSPITNSHCLHGQP